MRQYLMANESNIGVEKRFELLQEFGVAKTAVLHLNRVATIGAVSDELMKEFHFTTQCYFACHRNALNCHKDTVKNR